MTEQEALHLLASDILKYGTTRTKCLVPSDWDFGEKIYQQAADIFYEKYNVTHYILEWIDPPTGKVAVHFYTADAFGAAELKEKIVVLTCNLW